MKYLETKFGFDFGDSVREFIDGISPDIFHYRNHVGHLFELLGEFEQSMEIPPDERMKLDIAIPRHDLGYIVASHLLAPVSDRSAHPVFSSFFAGFDGLAIEDKSEIRRGIRLHDQDVLPSNTPLWVRMLRDFDRVARLGWEGATMTGYYLGLRYPEFNAIRKHETASIGNRHIPYPEVRERVKGEFITFQEFVTEKMVPDIKERRLESFAIEGLMTWVMRFDGQLQDTRDFVVGWDTNNWEVEPVMDEMREVFGYKRDETIQIVEMLLD